MKFARLLAISVFISLCTVFQIQGQEFLKSQGKAIVNQSGDTIVLRGMGLGGWMVQEGYMLQTAEFANAQHQIKAHIVDLIGVAQTEEFYEAWLSNHMRKQDVDSLKAWGFNSVRLPMHYNLYTLPIEEEPQSNTNTWLDKGFELTDSLISWCKANNLYVILDLHAAPGGQGYDQGISDYDPSKPSLWESEANKAKTVALWKRIAERYADETTVAGYDLINEPNWNLPGNAQLRTLYGQITDAIRSVDQNHLLFIEGNWFANDFTGLTPPWDDNMAYSPHKYWSINDKASIQWVLNLRDSYDIPIYFGESGENSNVWFRDAIRLLEDEGIGWAWWPLKKIEAIAGPLSIIKTNEYQNLLDYWNGNASKPSAADAADALMAMTENLKIEHCIYQKDVIDAMFRQVYSEQTIPFASNRIPGVIYCTDYDMGQQGHAYSDTDLANYHVTTGNYTAWNSGWSYRNDGVDIELCEDNINSNGFNVGWTKKGEWLQYEIDVEESAAYNVHVRVASNNSDGRFHLQSDEAVISKTALVNSTGGHQEWETITLSEVILTPDDNKLRMYIDGSDFNVSSIEFIKEAAIDSISTGYISSITADVSKVKVSINKPISENASLLLSDFQVLANGFNIPLTQVKLNDQNKRIIELSIDDILRSSDVIQVSYTGKDVEAIDATLLEPFLLKYVQNTLLKSHLIPGKIQAEEYSDQSGIELENTTDSGGGQNIGYLDVGDYAEYIVTVANSGNYKVSYRTASQSQGGQLRLYILDENSVKTLLHTADFPATGGWQSWTTTDQSEVYLPAGVSTLRIEISEPQFNINWIDFSSTTSVSEIDTSPNIVNVFPNPSTGIIYFQSDAYTGNLTEIQIYNSIGQLIYRDSQPTISEEILSINLTNQNPGVYYAELHFGDRQVTVKSFILD